MVEVVEDTSPLDEPLDALLHAKNHPVSTSVRSCPQRSCISLNTVNGTILGCNYSETEVFWAGTKLEHLGFWDGVDIYEILRLFEYHKYPPHPPP